MVHSVADTQAQFITKDILYALKRQHGTPATIRRLITVDNTVETGRQSKTYEVIEIKRAILLPEEMIRGFLYDLSFIAANKNFTYGGFFDNVSRMVLIDGKDLQVELSPNDHILIDGIRESIKAIGVFEHNKLGWLIATNRVDKTVIGLLTLCSLTESQLCDLTEDQLCDLVEV